MTAAQVRQWLAALDLVAQDVADAGAILAQMPESGTRTTAARRNGEARRRLVLVRGQMQSALDAEAKFCKGCGQGESGQIVKYIDGKPYLTECPICGGSGAPLDEACQ